MSLELIVGCMFAGKTTEIINITNRLQKINEEPFVIKPRIDNRYSNNKISSHNELKICCNTVDKLSVIDNIKEKYIIIDEAQFFPDLYEFVKKKVDNEKKHVIVIGLDGDSDRKNFGEIHKLLPLCDNIVKLKAYCLTCKDGTLALFSKRLVSNDNQILVGTNQFIPVCRECYFK